MKVALDPAGFCNRWHVAGASDGTWEIVGCCAGNCSSSTQLDTRTHKKQRASKSPLPMQQGLHDEDALGDSGGAHGGGGGQVGLAHLACEHTDRGNTSWRTQATLVAGFCNVAGAPMEEHPVTHPGS